MTLLIMDEAHERSSMASDREADIEAGIGRFVSV
jgi:hypothetical protein